MDLALRKKYYNQCNPDESLDPDDARNVDIDAESTETRGLRWVDTLAAKIELSDRPTTIFFSGLRGTGKSTELRRLAKQLGRESGMHLLPVVIQAEEVLDLTATIDVPDILIAIVQKVDEAVLRAEGSDAKPLAEGRLQRFWSWLTTTNVGMGGASMDSGVGAQVVLDFKTTPSRRALMRRHVADQMSTFAEMVREEIFELRERATKRGYSGIVAIVDSLEKNRGSSTTWKSVLESAENVFKDGAPYLDLPIHAVYTVPPAVVSRAAMPVEFLPMIKLLDREGRENPPGLEAAREVIRRRIPDKHLTELFGAQSREQRADELIRWSGGYPREMVRLLQLFVSKQSLDEALFRRLLGMAGDIYRGTVVESEYPLLAKIAVEKELRIVDESQREMVDRLLQNNIILRYQNDVTWVDIHPAVRAMEGVKEAISELERDKAVRSAARRG